LKGEENMDDARIFLGDWYQQGHNMLDILPNTHLVAYGFNGMELDSLLTGEGFDIAELKTGDGLEFEIPIFNARERGPKSELIPRGREFYSQLKGQNVIVENALTIKGVVATKAEYLILKLDYSETSLDDPVFTCSDITKGEYLALDYDDQIPGFEELPEFAESGYTRRDAANAMWHKVHEIVSPERSLGSIVQKPYFKRPDVPEEMFEE